MIAELQFTGAWRDYQARILADVDARLADGRLHVVAAPGSGKTVLGLEVMGRIGRPTLVLAPTNIIRGQWVDRMCGSFLPDRPAAPDWVSLSLAAPGLLTVCTYQALHAIWAGRDEAEVEGEASLETADTATPDSREGPPREASAFAALVRTLSAMGPVTIILDEAHHLRREWWRALQDLVGALDKPVLVALTATPPYDVEWAEWRRYEELCGPIDAEISVPELVRHGDLCPHQDYLHISVATAPEEERVAARRAGLTLLFERLLADPGFADSLAEHGWIGDPEGYEEDILDAPEFLSAMLIFLHAAGRRVPPAPLALLGVRRGDMPRLSPRWMEALLDGMVFAHRDAFDSCPWFGALKADLQRLGAIEGGRVRIAEGGALFSLMANSIAKLDSIVAIARSEAAALGDRLRMVVLIDLVRESDLPRGNGLRPTPAKLGVASIFDTMRLAGVPARLGVVSGSLVIVPEDALEALAEAARWCGVDAAAVRTMPLAGCPGYVRVRIAGADGHRIVAIVTRMFAAGAVTLLTGTQALLGEGWDAPSINTLVLASNVGSYMMSNQMRGRAIRTDPADPAKVANIWHLATVVPDAPGIVAEGRRRFDWTADVPPGDPIGRSLGPDMDLMKRRFRAFAGIGHRGNDAIESGIERLDLAGRVWDADAIVALDADTLAAASDRGAVAARWRSAIGGVESGRTMRQVVRPRYAPRLLAVVDTLEYLVLTGLGGAAFSAGSALRSFSGDFGTLVMGFAGLTLLYALPKLGKAAWLLVRNGSLERSLNEVGLALLESLENAQLLDEWSGNCEIVVERTVKGERLVTLHGADRVSERLFLDALAEIIGPVQNPRYLLVRGSWLGRRLRVDFHAVPTVLAQRKELAEDFAARWKAHVGRATLVFTRSAAGRRALLRARAGSLAAGFRRTVDALSSWR
ncbi:MAG: DEAD/DEAH box helicase family protein [Sphingomonas sp.]|jgi:superfamily II DNA or RNA helicase|uniref:DEAD/DEAH box helicase family protein n=1 Tax=Sphingomonas sp. TaxID=28214 RepID=UPI003563356A